MLTDVLYLDVLSTEWRLYRAESQLIGDETEVDKYWSHGFKLKDALGNLKYVKLADVVKSALSLSHGKSDVERDFSLNKMIVSDNNRNTLFRSSSCCGISC